MKLAKVLITTLLIAGVLCDELKSQSTFFMDEGEQPDSELIYINNQIHGFGVSPISRFAPDTAFKKACQQALEDLNTNLFLSVYIEEFRVNQSATNYAFPEFGINDTVLVYDQEIVKADSFEIEGNAYCIAELTTQTRSLPPVFPPIQKLMVSPQKTGDTWYAMGQANATRFNPGFAWMKAKNDAIQDLSKVLRTMIQSRVVSHEDGFSSQTEEITYFKSNIIFRNIFNVQRFVTEKSFITVVAVKENDIIEY